MSISRRKMFGFLAATPIAAKAAAEEAAMKLAGMGSGLNAGLAPPSMGMSASNAASYE